MVDFNLIFNGFTLGATTRTLVAPGVPDTGYMFEWTTFTESVDTVKVYVSSSEGNDSNDGLSELTPKATIKAGYTLLRDGYPDWLLLKRGDTWTLDSNDGIGQYHGSDYYYFAKSGRSVTEPMLVSTYGSGSRPNLRCFQTASTAAIIYSGIETIAYVAFDGLYCNKVDADPSMPEWPVTPLTSQQRGVGFLYGHDLLVQDCYFGHFAYGINGIGDPADPTRLYNITVRGCVIDNTWHVSDHNQGSYHSGVTGLLYDGCVFIHCGYLEGVTPATVFDRSMYWNSCPGAVVRNCIDIDGSSGGAQMRVGGTCEHNLFIRSPLAITYGHGQNLAGDITSGTIRYNVILGGRDIASGPRALGIAVGSGPGTLDTVEVYENIIAHNIEGTGNIYGLQITGGNADRIIVHDNIVYGWNRETDGAGIGLFCDGIWGLNGECYNNNIIQPDGGTIIYLTNESNINGVAFSNNTYYSTDINTAWFYNGNSYVNITDWSSLSGEIGASSSFSYMDPERVITTYMASLGLSPTIEAFTEYTRNQSRNSWDQRFTARAVINYVRFGFGKQTI